MRFLVDENVPLLVAKALESLGHDCVAITLVSARALDENIMAQARRENRILATFDSDFSRMIFHELQPPPPGVVYMRGRPEHARLVSELFLTMFRQSDLDLVGRFLIIETSGTVRSLPLGS